MAVPRDSSPRRLAACALASAVLGLANPASAGPPFVTDDPEPTDNGHWEIYGFASGVRTAGSTEGEAGADINYGAAPDLQLTAVLPISYERGDRDQVGMGDIELAAKLRVLHQQPDTFVPDVAIFPRIFAPTAAATSGPRRWTALLPVWVQKDLGAWQVFGGGGYTLNPGPGNQNYWISGLAAQRQTTERLSLGAELYHRSADTNGGEPFTGMNLGATYKVAAHWSLLAAGGPGLQYAREGGRYEFYLALKADY
jgi:hypothetical protein